MSFVPNEDRVARGIEILYIRAWNLFAELKYDEANLLSENLLREDRINGLRRAGLHVILAHSSDDYLWNAGEAVRVCESMYTDKTPPPTPEQAKSINELLQTVNTVQANARADKKELKNAPLTREEERLWFEQQAISAIEMLQNEKDSNDESDDKGGGPQIKKDELGVKMIEPTG